MVTPNEVLRTVHRPERRIDIRRVCTTMLLLCLALLQAPAASRQLQLEIQPEWNGAPLDLNRPLVLANVPDLSISRLDGLLSGLALQREDGTWLESSDWYVFFSAAKRKWIGVADGLPPGVGFQAIRFRVGLTKEVDQSDPNLRPVDHPLHPDTCGLHWGWQGGYVFCALEGHFTGSKGKVDGFSYHLAGNARPMTVALRAKLNPNSSAALRLKWEISTILEYGAVVQAATSTHSRAGDPVADLLAGRVSQSFTVGSIHDDVFQIADAATISSNSRVASATPFRLNVSQRLPRFKLPPDNPLTEQGVELGRRLFHEPQLSRNSQQSCASCHIQANGFADPRATSVGAEGQAGRRNAMPLANLVWGKEFFWDGRARTVREQVLMPIQDRQEMNETLDRVLAKLKSDPAYPPLFNRAFGSQEVSADRIARALEQYLLTLITQDSKFDRAARKLGTLTDQEKRGLELFTTEHDPARGLRGADCFHCHGGNLFTNHEFANNGLAERAGDWGRFEVTRKEADRGKFKVPSLRNVALTAPYMHDGRFATLEQVIEHYNGPMARTPTLDPNLAKHPEAGLNLSPEDKAALVAFLRSLTDEAFVSPLSLHHSDSAGFHRLPQPP